MSSSGYVAVNAADRVNGDCNEFATLRCAQALYSRSRVLLRDLFA
jgi:hypothetical protein